MPFIGKQGSTGNSKIKKYSFTATASQTAFSVSSEASDELQVFLNGVLLKETDDYTYTTSTVTLGVGATVSDIVEVHVYQSFILADAVQASIGGTFASAVTFSAGLTGDVTGNASGTAATVTTAAQPAITSVGTLTSATISGDLTVDTSTLKVDSSNNAVGIGTASPSSFDSAGNQLVVGSGTGHQGLTINSGDSSTGVIHFADGTTGNESYRGYIYYPHGSDKMQFGTAGSTRMTIDHTGNIETSTTGKIKQKGAFMQSSTHQALALGY